MRRRVWRRWFLIGGLGVASSAGCQLIAGLDGSLGGGNADAAAPGIEAGEPTCSPSTSCGDPGAGCCITHDGSAFTSACVTAGCAQSDMNLYFCYSPDDCPGGQVCCAHTVFSPPDAAPNKLYASICSPGSCPANYSTQICDPFHPDVCGDAGCLREGSPPSGFPTYYYCN
jgi:hypothetical protein